MRKYLLLTMALAGLIAVSVAGVAAAAAKPAKNSQIGNLVFKVNGGFSAEEAARRRS